MSNSNILGGNQGWLEKVLKADDIWAQVQELLAANEAELPETPRRPDIRVILNNTTGQEARFLNPGDHSASKEEQIPGNGEETAAMVMIQGETLEEQYANAKALFERYDLKEGGLSEKFLSALRKGETSDLVREAYGPAPFDGQAGKIINVTWDKEDGSSFDITPEKGLGGVFGARAASTEKVFIVDVPIFMQGSSTTPELIESLGIAVAVSSDWQTGEESTRPIVASVAREFYGKHFDDIPRVSVHPDGNVLTLDLGNGTVLASPQYQEATAEQAILPEQKLS